MLQEKYVNKVRESLHNALKYCSDSITDSDKREFSFWHVCTELEYCIFYFDLFLVKKDEERFRWRPDKELSGKLKLASLDSKLRLTEKLIKRSIGLMDEKLFFNAYKQTVIADVLAHSFYKEIRKSVVKKL